MRLFDASPERAAEGAIKSGSLSPLQGLDTQPNRTQGFTLGYFLAVPLGLNSENHFLDVYSSDRHLPDSNWPAPAG